MEEEEDHASLETYTLRVQRAVNKNKEGTFCWKQRQKSQKIYIEEGIF